MNATSARPRVAASSDHGMAAAPDSHGAAPQIALSYGLGADSTAVLLRWLSEPETRPCDLADLLVVTAMTGDEWAVTGRLVTRHILPRLRAYEIRYAQVARAGPVQADGVAVLDDSRRPRQLHLAGAFRLSDELRAAGTVPQVAGVRKCSLKAKGWPIDQFLARATGGRPYLHVMGYEAGEVSRARRDATYDTATRTGSYPLIAWGWDRAACERYIRSVTGADWPKSACSYCPYALCSADGRARVLAAFAADPAGALDKEGPGFAGTWRQALEHPAGQLRLGRV